jgi:hypothetical protein
LDIKITPKFVDWLSEYLMADEDVRDSVERFANRIANALYIHDCIILSDTPTQGQIRQWLASLSPDKEIDHEFADLNE